MSCKIDFGIVTELNHLPPAINLPEPRFCPRELRAVADEVEAERTSAWPAFWYHVHGTFFSTAARKKSTKCLNCCWLFMERQRTLGGSW